jgi:hypothetical protein
MHCTHVLMYGTSMQESYEKSALTHCRRSAACAKICRIDDITAWYLPIPHPWPSCSCRASRTKCSTSPESQVTRTATCTRRRRNKRPGSRQQHTCRKVLAGTAQAGGGITGVQRGCSTCAQQSMTSDSTHAVTHTALLSLCRQEQVLQVQALQLRKCRRCKPYSWAGAADASLITGQVLQMQAL